MEESTGVMNETVPYQMDVFFDAMQEIDAQQLQDFINGCDPDENDVCEVTVVPADEIPSNPALMAEHGLQLSGFAVASGDVQVLAILHNVKSPAADRVDACPVPDKLKERLKSHNAFALLNAFGGDSVHPLEKTILLYKTAMGLCKQGAIGLSCVQWNAAFPSEFLVDLLEKTKEMKDEDGEEMTLWRTLREHGEPRQLLTGVAFLPPEMLGSEFKKGFVVMTLGHAQLGFPDFVYHAADKREVNRITEFFGNIYDYLFENGPVIAAGHTMGADAKSVAYKFDTPPESFNPPFEVHNLLWVTPGAKKKKFLGLF